MNELRMLVTGLLSRTFVPLTEDDVIMSLEVLGARLDKAGELPELLAIEERDFRQGVSRDLWICPALNGDDGASEEEFLTLSSWPLRSRIVFGVLSEAQELNLLRSFCDLSISALEKDRSSNDLASMVERIEDLSIHLDAAKIQRYRRSEKLYDKLVVLREAAEDSYPTAMRREKAARDAVAVRLSKASNEAVLFGGRSS